MAASTIPAVDSKRSQRLSSGLLAWRPDAVSFVTVYLVLAFCLPARLTIPALGAAGRPADLFGIVGLGWWFLYGLLPGAHRRGASPLRFVLFVRLVIIMASLVWGLQRDLAPGEALGGDRYLLGTLSIMGIALVASDGILTRARLDDLLKRVTYAGGFIASVAFLQFNLSFDLTRFLQLPGLSFNNDQYAIQSRFVFNRVAGTANHAIEFAVVTGMMLPLAIHYAMHATSREEKQWRWILVGLIATGVPFSVSRAGVLAFAVGMLTLAMVWEQRTRINALWVSALGVCVLFAAVPGIIGTIRGLFTRGAQGKDTSITARTDDYEIVFALVQERPWLGRGAGTWLVDIYFTLDNEILGTLVQTGYLGLIATVAMWVIGYALPRDVRHRSNDPLTKHLAQAIAAVVMVSAVTTVTFDSFAFPIHTGFLAVVLGAGSCLWRLERERRGAEPALAKTDERTRS